ncbi:SGNH/GDSL hydrolase family protein [Rhabdobacter roseus]
MKAHLGVGLVLAIGLVAWQKPVPSLFLIGDSISIQYGPYLEKYLEGIVTFSRKQDDGQAEKNLDVPVGANGGDSRMVLSYLRTKLKDQAFRPDYLLLNCGLHDIKHNQPEGTIQVSEKEYRENLTAIAQLLRQRNIELIWVRTTPVVDTIHNPRSKAFKRYDADLQKYNQIADQVMAAQQVASIDLYQFTQQLGIEQFTDHVHYKEPARALQAAYLAGYLQAHVHKKRVVSK